LEAHIGTIRSGIQGQGGGAVAAARERGVGRRLATSGHRRVDTGALADPEEARASPLKTKLDRRRIKELERELLRKDRALAETAALLVLTKKVEAIFNKGGAE